MPDARRKWWIAGLLSLLLPGLGQVYNGQAKKGVALHLVLVAIFALMALGVAAGVAFKPLVLMALVLSGACFVLTVTEACISARRRGADYVPVRYNTWKVYVPALLAYLVVVRPLEGHLTRCFVQAYHIPAGAMEDALLVGDYLLADKFVYGAAVDIPGTDIDLFRLPARREPRAGDVIIFRSPVDPSRDLIKRCVAVGGQTVELRDKVLYVDGHEVEDTPLVKHTDSAVYPATVNPRDNFGPFLVPDGSFFMLGDNRDNSADSRFWRPVPRRLLRGKAMFVYWSRHPAGAIRWTRLFASVR